MSIAGKHEQKYRIDSSSDKIKPLPIANLSNQKLKRNSSLPRSLNENNSLNKIMDLFKE